MVKNNFFEFFGRSELSIVLLKFKREFFWIGIYSMLANILMLTPTIYMLQVYDRILISRSELTLLFLTIFVIFLFVIMAFSEWLRSRLLVRAGIRFDQELNTRIFNASFEAYLGRKLENPSEGFSNLTNLRQFLTGNGIIAFFDLPWTPIYIAVIFILHPILGFLSIGFAFVQLILALWANYGSKESTSNLINFDTKLKAFLQSKLKNADPVHAMGMLQNLRNRWLVLHREKQQRNQTMISTQSRQQVIIKFCRYSMQSLTLAAAALLVIRGELTAGAMIAANVLMTRALQPMDLVVGSWHSCKQAIIAFKSLETILTAYPSKNSLVQAKIPSGHISIKNLRAYSSNKERKILNINNLEFQSGHVIAILGPSGSGKTTLARCLVGVWPDYDGDIMLDEVPLRSWDRIKLGPHIGYLPQDVELLDGTIAENISRFYELNSELVIDAAIKAGVHEMVLRFPMGYDTLIGDGGSKLSGGQRQRIGLARALYGNPQIIVLDEPNANLDDIGEKALTLAVEYLKKANKTIILITHRSNILNAADDLLVLDHGEVTQFGPKELVLSELKRKSAASTKSL